MKFPRIIKSDYYRRNDQTPTYKLKHRLCRKQFGKLHVY